MALRPREPGAKEELVAHVSLCHTTICIHSYVTRLSKRYLAAQIHFLIHHHLN